MVAQVHSLEHERLKDCEHELCFSNYDFDQEDCIFQPNQKKNIFHDYLTSNNYIRIIARKQIILS